MNNEIKVSLELIDKKMKFQGCSENKEFIKTNYIHGEISIEHTPLELFLISLSSCLGGTVSALLRTQNKDIKKLIIESKSKREKEHPTGFKKILIKLYLESNNTDIKELEAVIKIAEEKICPVWSMIKGNVEIIVNASINS